MGILNFIGEDDTEVKSTPLDAIMEKKLGRFLEADLSDNDISDDSESKDSLIIPIKLPEKLRNHKVDYSKLLNDNPGHNN